MSGSKVRFPVIPGDRFGRWTVLSEGRKLSGSRPHRVVTARCDCGTVRTLWLAGLRSGTTPGCGCLRRERAAQLTLTHGKADHPQYNRWNGMMFRCYNQNLDDYPNYGGRGIRVCDRWLDVSRFIEDIETLGQCPDGWSMDRIDSDGNYELDNVRWASPHTQRVNQRRAWSR
jgi:hypothetical protein